MVRDELAEQVHVLASKASTVKSILAWAGCAGLEGRALSTTAAVSGLPTVFVLRGIGTT